MRTDEEVELLLTICKDCEHFNGKGCGKCGCRVKKGGEAWTNKLKMKTEHCPIDKW